MRDILLSKVAANSTDTAWAQAYSTINFYLVLSVEMEEPSKPIASIGKEVLERLQREFFALDQKDLISIKQAVSNSLTSVDPAIQVSLTLATISNTILYLVIANAGVTLIKRGEKIGVIGEGKPEAVSGFSGHLQENDLIVLQSNGFVQKITPVQLSPFLESNNVVDIAESVIPHLHENAMGNEAALLLQYPSLESEPATSFPAQTHPQQPAPESTDTETENAENLEDENVSADQSVQSTSPTEAPPVQQSVSTPKHSVAVPRVKLGKTMLLILAAIILIGGLLAGIYLDNSRKETAKNQQALQEILTPAEQDYNDAAALISLNKPLALEKLKEAQARLMNGKNQFTPGSEEEKKINDLLQKINSQINQTDGASTLKNFTMIVDGSKEDDLKQITHVSFSDNILTVSGTNGNAAVLTSSGSIDTAYSGENETVSLANDGSFLYQASDGTVTRIDQNNKRSQEIIDDAPDAQDIGGIDVYSSAIYILNKKDTTIERYAGSSYSKNSYFKSEVNFVSPPHSFTIDGSIWVAEEGGKIRKFSKGLEESFSVKGMSDSIGEKPLIFTDVDYSNLYILDSQKSRIVITGKDGVVKNQFHAQDIKNASSIAINEPGKKGYVVVNNKLYSFDL